MQTTQLLDGKSLAEQIKQHVRESVQQLQAEHKITPGLTVILVGDDAASEVYVKRKRQACESVGIRSFFHHLPSEVTQAEIEKLIDQCNHDKNIHGILLQLPLPKHLHSEDLLERIDFHKDVDGFHPYNLGRLAQRRPLLRPCTPKGIMKLLHYYHLPIKGKNAVVIGASNIVGRPMALELLHAGATVTVCHKFTNNLQPFVEQAEILIVAVGKRGIVQAEWIKPGSVVVDVGIHRLDNGDIVGDLDFPAASQRAAYITPVPGGVGPMTVAILLENTVLACKISQKLPV